jgi:hypothetical protein
MPCRPPPAFPSVPSSLAARRRPSAGDHPPGLEPQGAAHPGHLHGGWGRCGLGPQEAEARHLLQRPLWVRPAASASPPPPALVSLSLAVVLFCEVGGERASARRSRLLGRVGGAAEGQASPCRHGAGDSCITLRAGARPAALRFFSRSGFPSNNASAAPACCAQAQALLGAAVEP